MKKSYLIAIIVGILIIAGIAIGINLSKKDNTTNLEPKVETELVKVEKERENIINEELLVTVSVTEEKLTPNALFVFRTNYKGCGHITTKKVDVPEEFVNLTEEEIQVKYEDWKIETFTANEVILYQEEEGICKEHYVLKEKSGYVAIYSLDSLGNESLKELTGIVTNYLPETDLEKLKEGIRVNGQEELNAALEDYE